MKMNRKTKFLIRALVVVVASFISAVNINSFVSAGGLFPGGFNGLTVFLQRVFKTYFDIALPFSPINILLNAFPIYIGFKIIGRKFTVLSCLMIILTGVFVDLVPVLPITEDILLIAVFGGLINGAAMSMALRAKASGGGTDFIALAIAKKTNAPAWNYILILNGILLLIAGYLFGWESALYSIIFQFCSTQVINMLHTQYKKLTMFIVTNKPDEIIGSVMRETHHGFTRFEGYGGYAHDPRTMLYTVIGSEEARKVKKIIYEIDAQAFVNVTKTEQVEGKFYQKPMD